MGFFADAGPLNVFVSNHVGVDYDVCYICGASFPVRKHFVLNTFSLRFCLKFPLIRITQCRTTAVENRGDKKRESRASKG